MTEPTHERDIALANATGNKISDLINAEVGGQPLANPVAMFVAMLGPLVDQLERKFPGFAMHFAAQLVAMGDEREFASVLRLTREARFPETKH